MKQNNRVVGTACEQAAGSFLEKKGYRILEYNYRTRMGEIDIVAMDREYLVFCEVKYRATQTAGSPLEAVDRKKQRVLARCALQYMTRYHMTEYPARFDVIGMDQKGIIHIQDAFQAEY